MIVSRSHLIQFPTKDVAVPVNTSLLPSITVFDISHRLKRTMTHGNNKPKLINVKIPPIMVSSTYWRSLPSK